MSDPFPRLLPHVSPKMLSADFWLSPAASTLSQEGVLERYQQYIFDHTNSMTRLCGLWTKIETATEPSVSQLSAKSLGLPTPNIPVQPSSALYQDDGRELTSQFWVELSERVYAARPIPDDAAQESQISYGTWGAVTLQPGFAVRRADLRRYPTGVRGFRSREDREFDRFQDTALHTFEPVLIALQTKDSDWLYVHSTTYSGWVAHSDIARCTSEEFTKWADQGATDCVIPLTNAVLTQAAPYNLVVSKRPLDFAAFLPICEDQTAVSNQTTVGNLCVYVPTRDSFGWLDVQVALVSATNGIHIGFRPYTRYSVVASAFALLTERYGWGDSFGNHDCSSLIRDSYRTIGIQLPRDAGAQEEALPNRLKIPPDATLTERTELLKSLRPGDPLYMPGHTMLYLGHLDGHHYVIHDFAGYSEFTGNDLVSIAVNEVMVSTLDILTGRGKSYLEELTCAARLFDDGRQEHIATRRQE